MTSSTSEILIITGEASGDLIGASLINKLKNLDENLKLFGIGGNKMRAEGLEVIYHIDQMAFLGFAEVVKHIPFIKNVQKKILGLVSERNIKVAVLIDYPGFNLSIAEKLKSAGLIIVYYVSPQIWAWGKKRIKKIQRLVDKLLVVFPFEKEFYSESGIDVEFVGHPLVERVSHYNFLTEEELYSKFNLDKNKGILLVMPGSRKQEIRKIFPESINAAIKLSNKFNLQVIVACSENINEDIFTEISVDKQFSIVKGHNYDLMKYAKFGIIKSGTSTLEAGYFSLPMIIVYKTSFLTYLIGKQIITLDNIGMVNILLGKKVIPELIQSDVSEKKIFSEAEKVLSDNNNYETCRNQLSSIKENLGESGASEKAAKIIYKVINEN